MENKGRVVCQSHKKKAVAFCFNETCQKNKIICVTCLIRSPENHSGH